MNPYAQIVLTIISGILISAITSWISVRLAIRQFYSQNWWERKAEAYSSVIEALYHVKNNLQILMDSQETGRDIAEDQRISLKKKTTESYEEIYKAEGIGAFIISDTAANILTELRHDLTAHEGINRSFFEFLDENLWSVNKCLKELRDEAKRDLRINLTTIWARIRLAMSWVMKNIL